VLALDLTTGFSVRTIRSSPGKTSARPQVATRSPWTIFTWPVARRYLNFPYLPRVALLSPTRVAMTFR
jgi:hypothetical protein